MSLKISEAKVSFDPAPRWWYPVASKFARQLWTWRVDKTPTILYGLYVYSWFYLSICMSYIFRNLRYSHLEIRNLEFAAPPPPLCQNEICIELLEPRQTQTTLCLRFTYKFQNSEKLLLNFFVQVWILLPILKTISDWLRITGENKPFAV